MSEKNGKKAKRAKHGVIYKLYCRSENMTYVGQTRRSFKKRWSEHCSAVEKYRGTEKEHSILLVDWKIYEYGADAFDTEILERPLEDDLNDRERYWIAKLGTKIPNGYNKTDGGGARGRIELTESEIEEIIEDYQSGIGTDRLSQKYKYCSQFILDLLRNHGIAIRSHEENLALQRENIYYRLDPDTDEILEEYTSFALIGKWAQENGHTEIANASTAGLRTRYAMLFGTIIYGCKWDSSWSEEEKNERREKFKQSSKKAHENTNAKNVKAPSRKVLKQLLQERTRKDILTLYDISPGCLDNWRFFYCLGPGGEDLDGWETAPSQYTKSLKDGKKPVPKPSYKKLVKSLEIESLGKASKTFGVDVHTYKKWLRESNLPSTRIEIDKYLGKEPKPKKEPAKRRKIEPIEREKLVWSLTHFSTMSAAAEYFGITRGSYKRQLHKAELPDNEQDINKYLVEHGYKQRATHSSISQSEKMPNKEILANEIRTNSFSALGEKYGISDNGIRKWCRKLELPDASSVIKSIPDDEWEYAWQHWIEVKEQYENNRNKYNPLTDSEVNEILNLYKESATLREISETIHRDEQSVRRHLRKNNIDIDLYPQAKAIRCPELDISTTSITDMARKLIKLGLPNTHSIENVTKMICRVLNNHRKSYLGLTFVEIP